jgi:glycosyltransferase involved in cell wall biosynthesis
LKVLLVNDVAAAIGGAEILTYDLRSELRRRGHDARVFASDAHGAGDCEPDYLCFGTIGELRTLNRAANPRAHAALKRVLHAFQPDVVHVRMFMTQLSPLILPLLRDRPAVYNAPWYETICPTGLKLFPDGSRCEEPAGRACRRCLSRRAWVALMGQRRLLAKRIDAFDVIVANSETTRAKLAGYGVDATRMIYNGVPSRPLRPSPGDTPIIGYSGRLSHEKGVDTLVDAFARVVEAVPGAQLLLVGDGPLRSPIEARVRSNGFGARVTMTGHRTRDEAEQEMDAAWIQAVPSLLEEPFGIVAAEAMMRGTAIVASVGGGLGEIVEAGCGGVLVPAGDPEALATALIDLVRDRERVERLGVAGRRWAIDNVSVERCVDLFVELYEELTKR